MSQRKFSRAAFSLAAAGVVAAVVIAAVWMLGSFTTGPTELGSASNMARRAASGAPQLVAMQALPEMDGAMCQLMPVSAQNTLMAALQRERLTAGVDTDAVAEIQGDRAPLRVIRDTYPTYSAIAVDYNRDEVFLQDENLFGIKVFDRMTNTPPNAAFSEPKRMIQGLATKLEFNCGLYIDQKTGDIYSVANDTVDTLVIFPNNAEGNVKPMREINTPHGTFGIAVSEEREEMFLTVQHEQAVVVYNKNAKGSDPILRRLEGPKTRLADPHGIVVDVDKGLMFVTNHGSYNDRQKVGTGKFYPPSITVYKIDAQGDIPPLRIIEGSKTRLDWPAAMAYDSKTGDLFVANDADDSIIVFGANDTGDVAPKRVIQGARTGVKNPTGIYLDPKNNELWVSNMGNHSATVFRLNANGNVAPLRTIRSAPQGKLAMAIGNPGGVAYDSKRQEILVPNCVAHPQIAAFPRMGKENTAPSRLIFGQDTLLSRTMHDIRYDEKNDEFLVTNPFAQAILVYPGGANGNTPPVRYIQGPKTLLAGAVYSGLDRVEVDNVHNEIVVGVAGSLLFFPRTAQGDVAPIRIIKSDHPEFRIGQTAVIDPIHNVVVVGGTMASAATNTQGSRGAILGGGGAIATYERTANGTVKPKTVIGGPKTQIVRINQMAMVASKGWIVATQPGAGDEQEPENTFVGIWNITDDGDVPPHWKLGGPKSTLFKPRGVTLNMKDKEIIVADMRTNAILTFYFPEIF